MIAQATDPFADLDRRFKGMGIPTPKISRHDAMNIAIEMERGRQGDNVDGIHPNDIELLKNGAPNTYNYLSDPYVMAAVAKRQNLKMLENVETENKILNSLKYAFLDLGRNGLYMADAVADNAVRRGIENVTPELETVAQQVGGSIDYKEFAKEEQQKVFKTLAKSDKLKTKYVKADTWLGQLGLDITRQLPQLAGQAAATLIGGGVGGIAFMGATIGGAQYEQLVADGVDPDRAYTAAIGNAAVQSALEQVAFDRVLKPLRFAGKDGFRKIAAKEIGVAAGSEAITEFVQQFPEVYAEYWAKNPDASIGDIAQMMWSNKDEILKEAAYSGLIGGLIGGSMGGVKVVLSKRATNAQIKNSESVQRSLAESELLKSNPEFAVKAVNEANGNSSVFIDPEAINIYAQSNADIYKALGVDEQTVLEKQGNDQLVEINKAAFDVASAQNPAIMQALKNDLAFEESGYTYNQLNSKNEADIIQAQKEYQSERVALNAELGNAKKQLADLGFNQDEAKATTVLLSKVSARMAETQGVSQSQWLKENAPKFVTGEVGLYGQNTLGAEQLRIDTESWGDAIGEFISNPNANTNPVKVATTPIALTLAGAEIKPIYIDKSIMSKLLFGTHSQEMTPEVLKQIPAAMSDPLFIYQEKDKVGKQVIVSVLGLKDAKGDYMIVPTILDVHSGRYVVNKIESAYGKESIRKPNSKWVEKVLNGSNLRYINKKETTSWLATLGLQLPTVTSQYSGLSDTNIPNETDLVKKKLLYPELYQSNNSLLMEDEDNVGTFNETGNIYNQSQSSPKGSIGWDTQGRAIISVFENGDASTLIHEMLGHWVTQLVFDNSKAENAPKWLKGSRKAILDFVGHTEESFVKAMRDQQMANEIMSEAAQYKLSNPIKYDAMAKEAAKLRSEMVKAHEKMARAAEVYMLEGKAPTIELRTTFQKFKKWLLDTYQSIKSLGVEITPEIRQVFDRMLASEQEIQQVKTVEGWHEKLPDHGLELSQARQNELDRVISSATERAESYLSKIFTSFISQDNKIKMEERRKALTDEVMQDVSQEPVYIAINSVQAEFGNHYKDSKVVAKRYIDGKLPVDQEIHFDILAEMQGFDSGSEMAQRIVGAPKIESMVKNLVDGQMKREFQDVYGNKALMEAEARQAMYNDEGALINAVELQIIREKISDLEQKQRTSEERRQEQKVMVERAKIAAWSDLKSMSIKDASKTTVYMTAERRAYGKYIQALDRGDYEAAIKHKESQMYNHAMVTGSLEVKRMYESADRYLKKQRTADKTTFKKEEHFNQAAAILMRFGYVRTDYNPKTKTQTLNEYTNWINEEGIGTMSPAEWLLAEDSMFDNKQLTITEFKDVQNAIKNIKTVARAENALETIAKGAAIEDVVNEAAMKLSRIEDLPESQRHFSAEQADEASIPITDKLKNYARKYHYSNLKFANFMLKLDRYRDFGFWFNLMHKPIYEAQNKLSGLLNQFVSKEQALIEAMYPDKESRNALDKKVYYEELGTSVTKRYLLEMASHTGSESNRNVLFSKQPIGDDLVRNTLWINGNTEQTGKNIMEFLSKHLTANDWRYVQGSWDNVSFLFPIAQEMHKRATGFYMEQVEKVPFIVQTADGQQVVMKGGYYPLKEDYRASMTAEIRDEKPLYTEGFAMWMPTTNKGYTNSRTGATYSIDLRNTNRYKHIQSVAHDIAFREPINDMRKLLNNKDFRELIIRKTGVDGERIIREQIATAAINKNAKAEHGEDMANKLAAWTRRQVVLALLMGNIKTLTQNFANLPLYAVNIDGFGAIDTLNSIVAYGNQSTFNYKEFSESIYQKSAFMRDREAAPDYSLTQFTNMDGENKWMKWGGYLLARTDNITALPIWQGAYEKSLRMGKSESDAILFADTLIERSIGSGRAIDTASLFRGSDLVKIFTAMGSFMNTQYNAWSRVTGIALEEEKYMPLTAMVSATILFKMLEAVAIFDIPGEGEDKEKWVKKWATDAILFPLSVPTGMGVTTQAMASLINETQYSFRPSPVFTMAEKTWRLATTAKGYGEGKKSGAELSEAATGALSFTGIPLVGKYPMVTGGYPDILNKLFWNAYDILENGMDPQAQDLFKRRPKRER